MPADRDMDRLLTSAPGHKALYLTLVLSVIVHASVAVAIMQFDLPWLAREHGGAATGTLDVHLAGSETGPARPAVVDVPPDSTADTPAQDAPAESLADAPPEYTLDALAEAMPMPAMPDRDLVSEMHQASTIAASDTRIPLSVADPGDTMPALEIPVWQPELALEMAPGERQMLDQQLASWLAQPVDLIHADEPVQWELDGVVYTATATTSPARSAIDVDRAVVEISTRRGGRLVSVQMQLRKLAFSHYAQFINSWDPHVYLSRDVIDGRFHSNTAINIDTAERPRFAGPVTIASPQAQSRRFQRSGMFEAGLQTMAQRIPLVRDADPDALAELAPDTRVYRFDEDTRIRFHANGELSWWPAGQPAQAVHTSAAPGLVMLLAEDRVTLSVEGEVRGQVLVYSPRMIRITGSLVYAEDPITAPYADNWMSLVSDHTIQVAEARETGPGDLHIHGALFAANRFSVRGFRTRNADAELVIIGSLVAGSVSATEPRYATRIVYDPRLESHRAPGFPQTGQYVLESQDEYWQVSSAESAAHGL